MDLYRTFIPFIFLINISHSLYINTAADNQSVKIKNSLDDNISKDIWSFFQKKLGLPNHTVDLLKTQKDQEGTLKLLKKFIADNPQYNKNMVNAKKFKKLKLSNPFLKIYKSLLKKLEHSYASKLKTSLSFELPDEPQRTLKRSRRKISVKMVNDMPSEKIDDILKIFNEKYGINDQDKDDNDDALDANDDYIDDNRFGLPTASDPDYAYENLYEDEEDHVIPAKSNQNSQYGSFQDLILQATRNQWTREQEETKLREQHNEHFI